MSQQLYLMQHYEPSEFVEISEYAGCHKIGISTDPEKRLSILQGGTPKKLRLITTVDIHGDAEGVEQRLHDLYVHSHIRGEWYQLPDEDIDAFKKVDEIDQIRLDGVYQDVHTAARHGSTPMVELEERL